MLTIQELRHLALTLKVEPFTRQLGPFVLIQRPPADDPAVSASGATQVGASNLIAARAVALLFMFDDLTVASLPPLRQQDMLEVGRLPDCDLVLTDGSVSKRHARLCWDGTRDACTLEDLGSTNGTYLNTGTRVQGRVQLKDGDILSFGDAQYWFMLTHTLHAKLQTYGARGLGSHSG